MDESNDHREGFSPAPQGSGAPHPAPADSPPTGGPGGVRRLDTCTTEDLRVDAVRYGCADARAELDRRGVDWRCYLTASQRAALAAAEPIPTLDPVDDPELADDDGPVDLEDRLDAALAGEVGFGGTGPFAAIAADVARVVAEEDAAADANVAQLIATMPDDSAPKPGWEASVYQRLGERHRQQHAEVCGRGEPLATSLGPLAVSDVAPGPEHLTPAQRQERLGEHRPFPAPTKHWQVRRWKCATCELTTTVFGDGRCVMFDDARDTRCGGELVEQDVRPPDDEWPLLEVGGEG